MRFSILALVIAVCGFASAAPPSDGSGGTIAERLGYPAGARLLIIHADDFGNTHSVNRATIEALEKNWVDSASIMVPCPWFPEVARWAHNHPDVDLGIHLTLNSEFGNMRWRPVKPADPGVADAQGYLPRSGATPAAHARVSDLEAEARAQVDAAKSAGIRVSHLDPHMDTMISTPDFFAAFIRLGKGYGIPVRLDRRLIEGRTGSAAVTLLEHKKLPPGSVVLDGVLGLPRDVPTRQWLDGYQKILAPLPPGVYQLLVHLGYDDVELRGAMGDDAPRDKNKPPRGWGAAWRQADFDLVRNPRFQDFLKKQGFIRISWRDLARVAQ